MEGVMGLPLIIGHGARLAAPYVWRGLSAGWGLLRGTAKVAVKHPKLTTIGVAGGYGWHTLSTVIDEFKNSFSNMLNPEVLAGGAGILALQGLWRSAGRDAVGRFAKDTLGWSDNAASITQRVGDFLVDAASIGIAAYTGNYALIGATVLGTVLPELFPGLKNLFGGAQSETTTRKRVDEEGPSAPVFKGPAPALGGLGIP